MSEHRTNEPSATALPVQLNELLTPTLQNHVPFIERDSGDKPWELDGQLWIAFFGGVLPVTVIAYLNSRRLLIPFTQGWKIIAAGVIGFCAAVFLAALPRFVVLPAFLTSSSLPLTAAGRLVALLVYLYQRRLQTSALRVYRWYRHSDLASLLGPGLLAIIFLGLLQLLLVDVCAWSIAGNGR